MILIISVFGSNVETVESFWVDVAETNFQVPTRSMGEWFTVPTQDAAIVAIRSSWMSNLMKLV